MKHVGLINLVIFLFLVSNVSALKFSIDGDLSDWGITLDDIEQGLNSNDSVNPWVPSYPNMDSVVWIVEDDVDPQYAGGYDYGVHVRGDGTNWWRFYEPKVEGKIQPSPYNKLLGEFFDIEAMYIDEDDSYIYVAAVLSVPPGGYPLLGYPRGAAGDLAIDLDGAGSGGYGYEYGIRLGTWDPYGTGAVQFGVYRTDENEDWYPATDFSASSPSIINTSRAEYLFTLNYAAYVKVGRQEIVNGTPTDIYVIELAIPKAELGIPTGTNVLNSYFKIHLAEAGCGNDSGNISIPEFPTLIAPLAAILGMIFYIRRRKL